MEEAGANRLALSFSRQSISSSQPLHPHLKHLSCNKYIPTGSFSARTGKMWLHSLLLGGFQNGEILVIVQLQSTRRYRRETQGTPLALK